MESKEAANYEPPDEEVKVRKANKKYIHMQIKKSRLAIRKIISRHSRPKSKRPIL